jgi:pimeloyl-ACP methyl ester carboxylesterase
LPFSVARQQNRAESGSFARFRWWRVLHNTEQLWQCISCPTLLVYGKESWASNPQTDGRARFFSTAKIETFEGAGHWVDHDKLEGFLKLMGESL